MEGLFAVIFVIIGIVNFIMKQQEQGKSSSTQRPQVKSLQKPLQRKYTAQPPIKTVAVNTGQSEEGIAGLFDMTDQTAYTYESEGVEAENRMKTGSLDYAEQSQSSEGICDEHPEHERSLGVMVSDNREESHVFSLSEENLLAGIITAEIIGPPRSMKRSIR